MRAWHVAVLAGLLGSACAARHSVRLREGTFSIRLPPGWKHTPPIPGLYPRGMDGDGPYWSTLWTCGSYDYFHQWMQPHGAPALEGAEPREDWTATEYAARRELIRGREAVIETRLLVPASGSGDELYAAAATVQAGPGLWLVIKACVTSRRAREELLAAFRTIEFEE